MTKAAAVAPSLILKLFNDRSSKGIVAFISLILLICLAVPSLAGRPLDSVVVSAFNSVVVGPGALEVKLIAAKIAAKSDDQCFLISPPDESFKKKCRSLMYGSPAKGGEEEDNRPMPLFVASASEIGDALKVAEGIIITCDKEPMGDAMIDTLLSNAGTDLKHVCMLSVMGTRLAKAEETLRKKCTDADITVSIIRAGTLQGGGPGGGEDGSGGEVEYGLNKFFDNTIFDLLEARTSMAFDKFTLGVKLSKDNPYKPATALFGTVGFGPNDGTTGRTAAAMALYAAVQRDIGVDVSLSSDKGEAPPTPDEWENLLSKMV